MVRPPFLASMISLTRPDILSPLGTNRRMSNNSTLYTYSIAVLNLRVLRQACGAFDVAHSNAESATHTVNFLGPIGFISRALILRKRMTEAQTAIAETDLAASWLFLVQSLDNLEVSWRKYSAHRPARGCFRREDGLKAYFLPPVLSHENHHRVVFQCAQEETWRDRRYIVRSYIRKRRYIQTAMFKFAGVRNIWVSIIHPKCLAQ
jgi:hypothetical protein